MPHQGAGERLHPRCICIVIARNEEWLHTAMCFMQYSTVVFGLAALVSALTAGLLTSLWLRRLLPAPQKVNILKYTCEPSHRSLTALSPGLVSCRGLWGSSIPLLTVEVAVRGFFGKQSGHHPLSHEEGTIILSQSQPIILCRSAVQALQISHPSVQVCSLHQRLLLAPWALTLLKTTAQQQEKAHESQSMCLCRFSCTVGLESLQQTCAKRLQSPLRYP